MHDVFQIKNAVKHMPNILDPLRLTPEFKRVSTASRSGTKAIKSNGAVKGIGGHANHSIKALNNARK
jgi:hypothetical protein